MSHKKKFQIFLESQTGKTLIGEILRREGLYSTDLARIRKQVKEAALDRLSVRPGPRRKTVPRENYEALKIELEEKERALAEQAVEPAILRKKRMGVHGRDRRPWLSEEQKLEILVMIEKAKERGLPVTRSCIFWRINRRRVVRWRTKKENSQSLRNLKPGPRQPVHKLLPEEKEAVLQMARKRIC